MGKAIFKNQIEPSTIPSEDFTDLYVDSVDKHLKTKDDAGLVIDLTGEANNQIIELVDTPSDYIDDAGKLLVVKATEDGVEFTDSPTLLNLIVTGDFTVQGTTTTIDTTTLLVEDKNIELGNVDTPTDVTADGGGITVKGTTDKTILWVDATDSWTFNQNIEAPQIKLTAGALAVGKVLTSDADGLASWVLPSGGGWTDVGTTVILTTIIDKVGIGTSSPLTKIHVADGGTSGASPFAGTVVTVESPGATYLSILAPDAFARGIFFGEPTSNIAGSILYNTPTTPDGFEFRANGGINRMAIDATGNVILEKQIKIKGGVPALSKVLTSDAAGLATWEDPTGQTAAQDAFTSTNARFFGELGQPSTQGWTESATGSSTIDLVDENVFGVVKQVVRANDNVSDGLIKITIALTAQNWIDINDFGASYSGISRLDTDDGSLGFFSGLQADAAENPLATGNRRYGFNFLDDAGNLKVAEADAGGTSITFDGTGGNPLILFDDWFSWECNVPVGLGAAQFYINGILTTFAPTFLINTGGLGTTIILGSGSTSGVDRITYHDNFGATIFEESSTKILTAVDLALDIVEVFVPEGTVDYTITLPTGVTRTQGARIVVFTEDVATITFNSQDEKSLFNGLTMLVLSVDKQQILTLTNLVDNSNIYFVETVEDILQFEHSGVVSMETDSITIFDAGPATPTVRIKDIHYVHVDKKANEDLPLIRHMRPPLLDFIVTGGGDQVLFIYGTGQGTIRVGIDAPTSNSITGEVQLGKIVMDAGVITNAITVPVTISGTVVEKAELIGAGGRKLTSGFGLLKGSGAADKTIQVIGESDHEQLGRAMFTNPNAPDLCEFPSAAVFGFTGTVGVLILVHKLADGTLSLDSIITNTPLPEIDTSQFNNGGTLQTLAPNTWVALHAVFFCQTNIIALYYGVTEYANQVAAQNGYKTEDWEVDQSTKDGSHIGTILCKVGTLTDQAAEDANTIEFINRTGRRV